MNIDDIMLPGDLAWLDAARERLLEQVARGSPGRPDGRRGPTRLSDAYERTTRYGHFSLPRSVADEDEVIERRLEDGQTALLDPIGFFRFCLFESVVRAGRWATELRPRPS